MTRPLPTSTFANMRNEPQCFYYYHFVPTEWWSFAGYICLDSIRSEFDWLQPPHTHTHMLRRNRKFSITQNEYESTCIGHRFTHTHHFVVRSILKLDNFQVHCNDKVFSIQQNTISISFSPIWFLSICARTRNNLSSFCTCSMLIRSVAQQFECEKYIFCGILFLRNKHALPGICVCGKVLDGAPSRSFWFSSFV